jgi:hypothetical protein
MRNQKKRFMFGKTSETSTFAIRVRKILETLISARSGSRKTSEGFAFSGAVLPQEKSRDLSIQHLPEQRVQLLLNVTPLSKTWEGNSPSHTIRLTSCDARSGKHLLPKQEKGGRGQTCFLTLPPAVSYAPQVH